MTTIAEEWEIFRMRVIPLTASEVQVKQMKKAFYGGAGISLVILVTSVKNDGKKDQREAIQNTLAGLMKELTQFAEDVASDGLEEPSPLKGPHFDNYRSRN